MIKHNNTKIKLTATLLAACWTMNPLSALAAQSSDSQTDYVLPEIVVTATRTEHTIKDTPSTVQVITRDDIERRQSQTLRDVLRDATGVMIWKDFQGRSQIRIRGSESRHVLIMVDGRRISGELAYNSVNAFDIDRIRMDNVERVEIIRGPAGALYGSDAMGGVINIITKQPNRNEGRLSYEYAAWDGGKYAGPNMQFSYQGVNDANNFGWSITAGQHKPQPLFLPDGTTANYYGKEEPIALSGTWKFDNGNHLRVDYSKLWEQTDSETILQSQGRGMPDIPKTIKNDNTRTDWSVEYGGKNSNHDWSIRTYRSEYDKDYSSFNHIMMKGNSWTTLSQFDLVDRTLSVVEGRNSWHMGDNHLATAGFEWRKDEMEGTRIRKPGSVGKPVYYGDLKGVSDDASLTYRALYVQDEFQSGSKLLVIPSVRYDWSDQFDSQLTPRLGITYKAQEDTRIKAVIGKGYKTPTVNDLYHHWEMVASKMGKVGEFWEGNPDLKPEKSTDYELAVEKDWDKTSARVSAFRSEVKDLIEGYWTGKYTTDFPGLYPGYGKDKLRTYRNVPQATLQGFEGEVSRKLTDALKLHLGYTYLDAKDDITHSRLEDRPRHQINLGISYQPTPTSWNVSLDLVTLKDYWTAADEKIASEGAVEDGAKKFVNKSYSIINLMAQKDINKEAMLYLGVDNLSDHTDYNNGILGRMYRYGVQYKF